MDANKVDSVKSGLRAQDIQTSVQDVDLGPLNAEIKNVRLVGMAERLGHSRARRGMSLMTLKKLEYVASQFGIDSLVLPQCFSASLEELGWVRVEKKGDEISKVEETVPYFTDIYSHAGDYLAWKGLSEIEEANNRCGATRLPLLPALNHNLRFNARDR